MGKRLVSWVLGSTAARQTLRKQESTAAAATVNHAIARLYEFISKARSVSYNGWLLGERQQGGVGIRLPCKLS